MFTFMQSVNTPRGPGYFISALTDGVHCQVAIRERGIQKNPIFRQDEITENTAIKTGRSNKSATEPVLQVAEDQ